MPAAYDRFLAATAEFERVSEEYMMGRATEAEKRAAFEAKEAAGEEQFRVYLVPDEDCHATGVWVYVPKDDPRYLRALQGGHAADAPSRWVTAAEYAGWRRNREDRGLYA